MPIFNVFNINEELLGKIMVSKKLDGVFYNINKPRIASKISSTINRPMDFGDDLFAWRDYIHDEHKKFEIAEMEKNKNNVQANSFDKFVFKRMNQIN
jgi:hypothetical protein